MPQLTMCNNHGLKRAAESMDMSSDDSPNSKRTRSNTFDETPANLRSNKRGADSMDCDDMEEPLAKRINRLVLDPSDPTYGANTAAAATYGANTALSTSYGANNAAGTSANTAYHAANTSSQLGVQKNDPTAISQAALNGISFDATVAALEGSSQRMRRMIDSREMPDSLNLHYPQNNPTTNHHYFGFNKTLHELHVDKLRRLGKL